MAKYTRKLQKMGKYSYCVTLPKEVIDKYGWKERQKLVVEDRGQGHLVVRDWRRK